MLAWFKNAEAKTANTSKCTWLYFVFPDSFVFSYFNSNILYSVHLFGIRWSFAVDLFSNVLFQTFDYFWKYIPTKLLISLRWHILYEIYILFCETYTVIVSAIRILLIKTLSNFRTIKCWFTQHLDMYVLG